ncbi:MAG: hypothetical protein CVU91_11905 [Firmicutes bacterium HGW-Firmicutes-16]|nr:MAG: hypothetical protein CVU91_11905 [Firmicutes bacterium HGW-Firmicutes-16]
MLDSDKKNIIEKEGTYRLQNGAAIYAKTLNTLDGNGKSAIFIHGGGSGGNHTIVYRPSCWLLNKGLYSKIILPDRRGAGHSTPMSTVMSYEDNALDMKQLLDSMGAVGDVTAIGVSYGGPIALTLAAIDERINEVILVASSPSLKPAKGIVGFLYHTGLLEKLVKSVYSKNIGKLEPEYPDFDCAYDTKKVSELKLIFFNAIRHMEKKRLQSLLLENASTCDVKNAGISTRHKINVPVFRIIGTKDETWEVELGNRYEAHIPNIKSVYIQNAGHKDVFFRASEFYGALAVEILNCK